VAAVALIAVLAMWGWHVMGGHHASEEPSRGGGSDFTKKHVAARTLDRASVAGTIRDQDGKPIVGARVCADASNLPHELVRDPSCATSDAQGAYVIANLYAAEYSVAAMAPQYLPESFHPSSDDDLDVFSLRAGEHRTSVDISLVRGGVEVRGVVSDISGGQIVHASVRAREISQKHSWPTTETDDTGAFSLWVAPGDVMVSASADGYAEGFDFGRAPGKVKILLTPESSVSGTVVDAKTNEPVADVTIQAGGPGGGSTMTDEQGHFNVTRITPGRYTLFARSPHGYGHSDGSWLVGLGQHVTGIVVKLHPAFQVAGRIVEPGATRATCKQSSLLLHQAKPTRSLLATRDADGALHVDGVLPGTYEVTATCSGFVRRATYPAITITDKDVAHLEWDVDAGAELHGRVLTKAGMPVGGATIMLMPGGSVTSRNDGSYQVSGLRQGSCLVSVQSEHGVSPTGGWKIDVHTTTVEKDLVLDQAGTINGLVVAADGSPVEGVSITAVSEPDGTPVSFGGLPLRSGEDGRFVLEGVRPGSVRVTAHRGWGEELRAPGTNDDATQGERVTVVAGHSASVRLVVESLSAEIKGTCADTDGKPITDAYLSAARESDAAGSQRSSIVETRWSWENRPTLTSTDGTFRLGQLSPGSYTVRAERKGGGEAFAEHVAAGTSISLVFKPTGQIDGLVHGAGGALDELTISLRDDKTGLSREEEFFRTGGVFAIRDIPAGHFTITASAGGGKKQITLDLGDGEHKKVDVQLDSLVTLTGRIVELGTTTPVLGILMTAALGDNLDPGSISRRDNTSDATGHFTIKNAPSGMVRLFGLVLDPASDYDSVETVRKIDGSGTIDLGDISILKRRLKPDETEGELGVHWVEQPYGTPAEQQRYEISWIDPNGAAAKSDLKVGDVVTTVDGIDVQGANHRRGHTLMTAPPGTKLTLGLARGATATVVLRAPP
jgi:protocatechuate 3,4-dioxygenase beta subunit